MCGLNYGVENVGFSLGGECGFSFGGLECGVFFGWWRMWGLVYGVENVMFSFSCGDCGVKFGWWRI
jgi:hypothetical protein